ncbi:MAG: efflux RND transporter permease subunit [Akkermansia sp.]
MPVSIIATFALFPLLGFTLNTICLMGMVLAIGLVVDDAIVVVEAVESHMERGLTPRQAAFAAMRNVRPRHRHRPGAGGGVPSSLSAPGITGTLFQQFAVTIAISMLISAFNAPTLSPALSAILLKPKDPSKGGPLKFFYRVFNRSYDATASGYTKVCHFLTRKLIISIPLLALIAYAIVPVAKKIPNGFLPDEDQGYLFAALIMPEARSLQLTTAAADKVSDLIRQNPNVKDVIAISGFSLLTGVQSTNNAFFFVMLKPWEERPNPDQSAQAVTAQLNALLTTKVSEGITMCFQPPAIAGVGSANGVTFMLEDRDGKGTEYLAEQTDIFVKEANKLPIFDPNNNGGVRSVMSFAVEQKDVRLDEEKCATLGVSISEANSLLQAYMGSLFINYITLYGQQWQVYIQAQGSDRTGTDMLKNFYVKNNTGSSVPLSTREITDIKVRDSS